MDGNTDTATIRDELRHIADSLPEGATWDDVMEEVYLQIVIERGLKAGREERMYTTGEIRKELGLPR